MIISPPSSWITATVARLAAALDRLTHPIIRELGWPGLARPRTCVACGRAVLDSSAFLRYRGEYCHAGPCLERDPPALRHGVLDAERAGADGQARPLR